MVRWQKIAWFNLAVIAACLILCFVVVMILPFQRLATPPTPLSLVIIPALLLVGLSNYIFRKKSGQVDFDERDQMIQKRSRQVGLWAFTATIILELMICFFVVGPKGTLQYPLVLLIMICAAGFTWLAAESISVLVKYSGTGNE